MSLSTEPQRTTSFFFFMNQRPPRPTLFPYTTLFREDLFYRLNVITITLPPLRKRTEDIPLLAQHFLAHYARENEKQIRDISPQAMEAMLDYHWPGNVRELENVKIGRAHV